jgi:uncharacterized protein (DUF488 family)
MKMATAAGTIHTIGHSTHPLEEFVQILQAHGVRAIADVRLIPKSRRHPHFNADALTESLPRSGIAYHSFQSLGGRRRPRKDSPNTAWRNESFRGYADYMQTPAFEESLTQLVELARRTPTTTMCAEAVPWRCHRSLISDALLVRGWNVLDILSATKAAPHKMTPFARLDGLTITYPPQAESPSLFPDP